MHIHQFDAIEAEDHVKEDGIDKPPILEGLYAKKFHNGETHEKESVKELLTSKGVVGVSGSTVEKVGVVCTLKELLASKGVVGVSGSTVEKGGWVSTSFHIFF